MVGRHWLLWLLPLALWTCMGHELKLKVTYDQVQGLKKDARVMFSGNHIGDVTRVHYSADGYFMVDLSIEKEFAHAVTEYAEFFIITDPDHNGSRAIEMIQVKKGGKPLPDGSIIEGTTRSSALFNKAWGDVGQGIEDFTEHLRQFSRELHEISESEAVEKLKGELERLSEEIKRLGKSAREKIEQEILPLIKKQMEELRERLEKHGREKELDPLQEQLEKIRATRTFFPRKPEKSA